MQKNDFLKNYGQGNGESQPSVPAEKPAVPVASENRPERTAAAPADTAVQPKRTAAAPAAPKAEKQDDYFVTDSGFHAPQPTQPAPAPAKKSRKGVIIASVLGVVAVAVIIVCVTVFGGLITVPNFSTYTAKEVSLWCTQNSVNLSKTEEYSDDVEVDGVISQGTAAGQKIRKNDFLAVTISLGSDQSVELELPDLVSMTKAQIEQWASENKMSKVRITTEASDKVESGAVIRYEINDNTVLGNTVKRSTPIYVIISRGSEAVMVSIPDFSTMSVSAMQNFARENKITVNIEETYDKYTSAGSVISQSVKSGEKLAAGSSVTVTISKGQKVTVPDFSLLSREDAQARATELGIRVSIKEMYDTSAAGVLISQSIKAGSAYGSEAVELRYSLGNTIQIESFVGQQYYLLSDFVEKQNANGANLTLRTVYTQNSAAGGMIISQSNTNTRVGIDQVIDVVVSQGKRVSMPDFIAPEGAGYEVILTRDEITEMCEKLGIIPVFQSAYNAKRHPGEVWSQSIAAGTEVSEGTVVTLTYAPSNKTLNVPNLKYKSRPELEAYRQMLNIVVEMGSEPVEGYAGRVYGQSIDPGTTVAYGTKITVYISPLPPEEQF